jgi:hypothetical protein
MSYSYLINNTDIPESDIKAAPKTDEKIIFGGKFVIASEIEIILDNTDPALYDPFTTNSLFFGVAWYNDTVEIYQDGNIVFKGKLKDISRNDNDHTLTLKASNNIKELIDQKCVISSSSNTTPADLIYDILIAAGIDEDDIYDATFQTAINIQTTNTVYANCTYTKQDNKSCLQVIEELCRISNCSFYLRDNKICLYQWEEYSGALGYVVRAKNLIEKSFKFESDDSNIYNDYSIAYDSAGTVARATGTDAASITQYGEKSFVAPNESVNSTATTAHKIILKNSTGAAWIGAQILSRYSDLIYKCSFSLDNTAGQFDHIRLGDQLDLLFDSFQREPVRLVEMKRDDDKFKIDVSCEFLNLPVEFYSRDTTAPEEVEIMSVYPSSEGALTVKWTQSPESDHLGYLLYFSASNGEFESEFSKLGVSPVELKNPDISPDGYCFVEIGELNPGTIYYFKVKSFDTSYNESDFSNTVSCRVADSVGSTNDYCVAGDIGNGIELDYQNLKFGEFPDEFVSYDEINYDAGTYGVTAIFESGIFDLSYGFDSISVRGFGEVDDIQFSYRTSDDGSIFSAWSTPVDICSGKIIQSLSGKRCFQYRFIFYSSSWWDSDLAYVDNIQEAS